MGERVLTRRPSRPEPVAEDSGTRIVVDEHRSVPMPKTKRFDFGLIAGANREPVYVGIDASATHHAIAAVGSETGKAYAWVLVPKTLGPQRLIEIEYFVRNALWGLHMRFGVLEICMEEYAFGAVSRSHLLGEVGGITKVALLRALGQQNKVAYPTFPHGSQVKKFATGSGKGEKSDMKMAVLKKWGWEVKENNAADALALAQMARALHTGETSFAYEAEVITKLEHHSEWPT